MNAYSNFFATLFQLQHIDPQPSKAGSYVVPLGKMSIRFIKPFAAAGATVSSLAVYPKYRFALNGAIFNGTGMVIVNMVSECPACRALTDPTRHLHMQYNPCG